MDSSAVCLQRRESKNKQGGGKSTGQRLPLTFPRSTSYFWAEVDEQSLELSWPQGRCVILRCSEAVTPGWYWGPIGMYVICPQSCPLFIFGRVASFQVDLRAWQYNINLGLMASGIPVKSDVTDGPMKGFCPSLGLMSLLGLITRHGCITTRKPHPSSLSSSDTVTAGI